MAKTKRLKSTGYLGRQCEGAFITAAVVDDALAWAKNGDRIALR